MTGRMKVRFLMVCVAVAAAFTVCSMRLVQLQVFRHDYYWALAAQTRTDKETIAAQRGSIQDAGGELLAANEPLRTVIADGSVIKDGTEPALAALLAGPLGMDAGQLARRLAADDPYMVLKKGVAEGVAEGLGQALAAANGGAGLRGIHFEPAARRIYPNGHLLSHVLGFVNAEGRGVDGIERALEDQLRGSEGFRWIERDRKGRELVIYRGEGRAPRDGNDVRLTVDLGIQHIVESELAAAFAQFKPESALVVVMRPATGEILALANRPDFDPNEPGKGSAAGMIDRSVLLMVEPGSTFKIVTAAAALEERKATLETMIQCEGGSFSYGGKVLRDHHPYGELSVEDVLAKSSNIGAAKLAMRLGDLKLYEYIRRFGFGERTGVLLPGEIPGQVHPPHRWTKISITRIPMGHEVAVTPIQLVTAVGAVANGGHLMMPQIVKAIVNAAGTVVQQFPPVEVRRVISEETAAHIRRALQKVVSDKGTAALARVPGFPVGGKTGTAQKIDPKGGYADGKYVVSFVGFLPADRAELAILVMMDEAQTVAGMNYGGLVCAPVFRQIAERVARHLDLVPAAEPLPAGGVLTKAEEH